MPTRRTTAANRGSARTESQAWSTLSSDDPVKSSKVACSEGPRPPHDCRFVRAAGPRRGGDKPLLDNSCRSRSCARATAPRPSHTRLQSWRARTPSPRPRCPPSRRPSGARRPHARSPAPPVDVCDAKQRPRILRLFGGDGLVDTSGPRRGVRPAAGKSRASTAIRCCRDRRRARARPTPRPRRAARWPRRRGRSGAT